MQGIKLILNEQIETNMDALANVMNATENIRDIEILVKSTAGYLLKTWGILHQSNKKIEGQLKLFRTNKKTLISKRLAS